MTVRFPLGSGLFGITEADFPQQQPSFNDRFTALMNNPMLHTGLTFLGAARSQNPMGTVAESLMNNMTRQQMMDIQRQNASIGKRREEREDEQWQFEKPLKIAEADAAARNAALREAMMRRFGLIPPEEGGMMDTAQAPMQGGGMPAGVNPQAAAMDMVFNGGRGIAGMMNDANKPITGPGNVPMFRTPEGGLRADQTGLDLAMQMKQAEERAKAGYDFIEVPQPDGSRVTMRKDVAAGAAQPQGGGVAATNFANNNFGNIRPPGQSKGFAAYATPEEGLRAIDQNLSAYGSKHGIDTVAGVVNRWLGGGADGDNVAAVTKNIAAMSGFGPNDKIDLKNPATRHILGAAIMRQEHGTDAFKAQSAPQAPAAPGVIGRTPSSEQQKLSEARGAQHKVVAEEWGKRFMETQKAADNAHKEKAHMELLRGYLRKGSSGALAPTTLGLSKFADALGFKIDSKMQYTEAAASLAKQLIGASRSTAEGGGLPGAVSNFEDKLLIAMQPNIEKLPGANEILANVYIRKRQRTIDISRIMADYKKQNGGVLDDGVTDIVNQFIEKNPLFAPEEAALIESTMAEMPQPGDQLPGSATRITGREVVGKKSNLPQGVKFLGFR